jgi:mannose/fructose/N-acetylgalactosamine-specific phosphotransferase system component IIC
MSRNDTVLLLMTLGFVASVTVSARLWDHHWLLRLLPAVYGAVVGLIVGSRHDSLTLGGGVEAAALGLLIGGATSFAIWVERRARD